MNGLTKALVLRFVRSFVAGAVSSMLIINIGAVNTFTDLKVFLSALALSAIVGGVNAILLTADKYLRSSEIKSKDDKVVVFVAKKKATKKVK